MKCVKAAFQSFDKAVLSYSGKRAAYDFSIVVQPIGDFRLQVCYSLISGVCEVFCQDKHCFFKQVCKVLIEFIPAFYGAFHLRKIANVFTVSRYAFDVGACPSYCQRFYDSVAYLLSQFFKFGQIDFRFFFQFLELFDEWTEECSKVGHSVNSAVTWILEEKNFIVNVSR